MINPLRIYAYEGCWRRCSTRECTEPERRLEPDEVPPVAACHVCGGEIYPGEVFGDNGGRAVCLECVEDQWRGLLPVEKFCRMGCVPMLGLYGAGRNAL